MTFHIWSLQWLVGLALLGTTVIYVAFTRVRGRSILSRARKTSTSKTPPRSLSPEKKPSASSGAPDTCYSDALPPPRREAMLNMKSKIPKTASKHISEEHILKNILPMTQNYETASDGLYTSMGFSVKEIKEMGDFLDYSALSGVPLPNAHQEFKIEKALPRPYRPFRWNYHQTMSLKKLETDWWVELENTYKERIAQRKALYEKHGKDVLDWMPGSELACKELMEMVLQFICARYPQYFSIRDDRILVNKILETEQDIRSKQPLEILMDNVPEDFAITLRDDKTGYYVFRAGVICSSLGWNVGTKIGLQLHEIHAPVPDYKEKMRFSMDRFFTKMPADKPIQRGSWGLEIDKPLYMPAGHPHEQHRLSQKPDLALKDCFLRVDWQTLRRLPISGGIVFNFKAIFTPVQEFRDEPKIPALVAKILRNGKENLMKYKSTWHVEHVVLPALDKWNKEQEDSGAIERNWEVTTLDEDPWYKGWEDKWHRQQGF
ncbi:conserved hypothetical protein [Talaromyces stipitatus ATCC 10500]|uniref:HRQ family protein n=1 Tax=Talaromyces stipitatus (strain ATCC 10500 / CBS 375.48 / QM 6759 / NRRL 1006) TaxID=441959 RepID=B8MD55_TALSN|nr:uncharacterized protein TSTA_113950 [Talaromyces stipitatus ATCC 10500]EED17580.1 conserved hypothetical protein [Talaromyces stipitatus ATCC 10500]